jgi:catechol 2,3-dioxygenase-like lactoylglutathione lyase family enzyme
VSLALDHVVIAVADLAAAVADYRALGFTVQIGGRHPGRTSHNALVVFEDGAYLELIAWEAPGPAERWYNEHARHGDGYMDFALLPEDTAAVVGAARSRGLDLAGPVDGGRVRPDGRELRWQTARPSTFDLPFLCGDVSPRDWRVPAGQVRRHANGVTGIATVMVAVRDLEASAARYRALLAEGGGVDGQRVEAPVATPATGLHTAAVRLGASTILLAQPLAEGDPASSSAARIVRSRLEQRGEGPCAMTLATAGAPRGVVLDLRLAHGAVIET